MKPLADGSGKSLVDRTTDISQRLATVDSQCAVCSGSRLRAVFRFEEAGTHVMKCGDCDFEFVQPFVVEAGAQESSIATDDSYVEAMKTGYAAAAERTRQLALRRLELYGVLRRAGSMPRIAEIGSGAGWMVQAFRQQGADCIGIELDPALIEAAGERGVELIQGDICGLETDWLGRFDVVCASQVLEHIREPYEAISRMTKLLRPGGLLHVDVPNGDSWGSRLRRLRPSEERWGVITLPPHQMGYRRKTLTKMFERARLSMIGVFERPTNDPVFGQTVLPQGARATAAMTLSWLLGHGYLLVGLAARPSSGAEAPE